MKSLLLLFLVCSVSLGFSQEACEELDDVAGKYLAPKGESAGLFISDGQVYTAFFSGDVEEEAEFMATFYGGSTYRIAVTAGTKDKYVIFELRDIEGNTLFTNAEQANAEYWDFQVESTIDLSIIVKLDQDKKDSGCATMLIGFKQ